MLRLKLEGSPREMGLQHGETLRQQIRELASIRHDLVRRRMPRWSAREIGALARSMLGVLARHPEACAEFEGIAQASGVSPEALMILNNYTDMRDFSDTDEGCSTFAARHGTRYVCGQTWDMHASARPYVAHVSKEGNAPVELLTLAGCLAIAGVSRRGLGVFINNMNCAETATHLMWPALVHGMLRQPSGAAAVQFLRSNLPCSGHNYLVCDDEAITNVEATGLQMEAIFSQAQGTTFHTNHYVGRLRVTERKERRSATTLPRYAALKRYFSQAPEACADVAALAHGLCSAGGAHSVYVPFSGADQSLTCGGMLYDMTRKQGLVFAGAFDEAEHSHFSFRADATPAAQPDPLFLFSKEMS